MHCTFQSLKLLIEGHTLPAIDENLLIEGHTVPVIDKTWMLPIVAEGLGHWQNSCLALSILFESVRLNKLFRETTKTASSLVSWNQ